VEANAEELSSERTTLPGPTSRLEDGWAAVGASDKEVGGLAIHGMYPLAQALKVRANDIEERLAMNRIEGVLEVEGTVNPGRVGLECGIDCVDKEVEAGAGGTAELGWPG